MGNINPIDVLSDVGSFVSVGVINIKKGRVNVPFSGAQIGDFLKGISNLYTGEQLRHEVNDTFSTPFAKTLETVAGAIEAAVVTAGVGSALSAPAAAAEVGAEGSASVAATGATVAGTEAAAPAIGSAASGSSVIAAANTPAAIAALTTPTAAALAPATVGAGETGLLATSQGAVAPAITEAGTEAATSSVPNLAEQFGQAGAKSVGEATTLGAHGIGSLDAGAAAAKSITEAPILDAGWWASQSPQVKAAIIGSGVFVGGQMVTGAMGGMFAGVSAEKKLQLESLINQQRQTQIQYQNKNNSYAPSLKFNTPKAAGVLATSGVKPVGGT
jgi:hypothetical protein